MASRDLDPSLLPQGVERATAAARIGASALLGALSEISGETVIDEAQKVYAIAERIMRPTINELTVDQETIMPRLTTKESRVLELVSGGLSNNQMAAALEVTEQTVKFHLSNIYRKLDVKNRTQAAKKWLDHTAGGTVTTATTNGVPAEIVPMSGEPLARVRAAAALLAVSQKLLEGVNQDLAPPSSEKRS